MKGLRVWQDRAEEKGYETALRELHTASLEEINRWATKAEMHRLLLIDLKDAIRVLETVNAALQRGRIN